VEDGLESLTNGSDITTAPAETSFVTSTQASEITVTAFSTITESASCDASSTTSTTDNGLPPIYAGPTTTTTTTTSPAVSACATPAGQFLIQLDNTNLYLTGENGGPAPNGNRDQRVFTTSDYTNAISFSAATDGNGQTTLVSAGGTTLFSDQDSLVGSGDGPIYWDSYTVFSDGDYFPVQFCLQPDNSFVVQNRLGTDDTADDANVVQICPDGALYLQTPSNASASNCNTVNLRLAQIPPGYPDPASSTTITFDTLPSITTTTSDTLSSSATTMPSPSVSSNRFRMRLASNSNYLTSTQGTAVPASDETVFYQTSDPAKAMTFEQMPGQPGQVMVLNSANQPLYPNQNAPAGNGAIYADTVAPYDSNFFILFDGSRVYYNSVLFFVQPDNTITAQNLGSKPADSSDDASTVVLCSDGAPLDETFVEMYAPINSASMPAGCVIQTLVAEFVPNSVPTVTTTSATPPATTTTTS
jgi:hypothetical protein